MPEGGGGAGTGGNKTKRSIQLERAIHTSLIVDGDREVCGNEHRSRAGDVTEAREEVAV